MVKNGLYRVDHDIFVNMAMAETLVNLTLEDLHKRMVILLLRLRTNGKEWSCWRNWTRPDLYNKSCDPVEYAKTTHNQSARFELIQGRKFGGEIHSDVWGPSQSKHLVENNTMWVLRMITQGGLIGITSLKRPKFSKHTEVWSWRSSNSVCQPSKCYDPTRRRIPWKEFSKHLTEQGQFEDSLSMIHLNTMVLLNDSIGRFLKESSTITLQWASKEYVGEAITHVVWLKNRTQHALYLKGRRPTRCCMEGNRI